MPNHRLQAGWGADICRQFESGENALSIPVILTPVIKALEETAATAGADGLLKNLSAWKELLSLFEAI